MGQDGPYAAGHDINYLAVTGALNATVTKNLTIPS